MTVYIKLDKEGKVVSAVRKTNIVSIFKAKDNFNKVCMGLGLAFSLYGLGEAGYGVGKKFFSASTKAAFVEAAVCEKKLEASPPQPCSLHEQQSVLTAKKVNDHITNGAINAFVGLALAR